MYSISRSFSFFHNMGNTPSFDTETANELYFKESAKRGLQVAKAFGTSIVLSPVIILALPFVGAYEFSTALEEEMITGYKIVDGMIGGLFGVIASPIAPLYCFLNSMQEIFSVSTTAQHRNLNQSYLRKAYGMLRLDVNAYNVVVTGCPGTGKVSMGFHPTCVHTYAVELLVFLVECTLGIQEQSSQSSCCWRDRNNNRA